MLALFPAATYFMPKDGSLELNFHVNWDTWNTSLATRTLSDERDDQFLLEAYSRGHHSGNTEFLLLPHQIINSSEVHFRTTADSSSVSISSRRAYVRDTCRTSLSPAHHPAPLTLSLSNLLPPCQIHIFLDVVHNSQRLVFLPVLVRFPVTIKTSSKSASTPNCDIIARSSPEDPLRPKSHSQTKI